MKLVLNVNEENDHMKRKNAKLTAEQALFMDQLRKLQDTVEAHRKFTNMSENDKRLLRFANKLTM